MCSIRMQLVKLHGRLPPQVIHSGLSYDGTLLPVNQASVIFLAVVAHTGTVSEYGSFRGVLAQSGYLALVTTASNLAQLWWQSAITKDIRRIL